jgi:hypothetical protein
VNNKGNSYEVCVKAILLLQTSKPNGISYELVLKFSIPCEKSQGKIMGERENTFSSYPSAFLSVIFMYVRKYWTSVERNVLTGESQKGLFE